jgi:hypothetical protein
MKPVMRALQTIAALQTETRDGPAEAASTWPTERTPLAELEQSSLASCNGRNGRTAPSANSKATADLNNGSGAPRIAQAKATISEAAFAWDREIRIDKAPSLDPGHFFIPGVPVAREQLCRLSRPANKHRPWLQTARRKRGIIPPLHE